MAETAIELFREDVFKGRPTALRGGILAEVKKDRDGQVIDHQQVKIAVGQYIYMGYEPPIKLLKKTGETEYQWYAERKLDSYTNDYEKFLLEDTEIYYRTKAKEWLSLSCFEYCLKVQKAVTKEMENADLWYDQQTKPKVLAFTLKETIEDYAERIVELSQGVETMFQEKKPEEL